jgi:hypothetical protein
MMYRLITMGITTLVLLAWIWQRGHRLAQRTDTTAGEVPCNDHQR